MHFYFQRLLLIAPRWTGSHMGSSVEFETKDEFLHQTSESKLVPSMQLPTSSGLSMREEDAQTIHVICIKIYAISEKKEVDV